MTLPASPAWFITGCGLDLARLVLGKFGFDAVTGKFRERLVQIEAWREQALGANFPEG